MQLYLSGKDWNTYSPERQLLQARLSLKQLCQLISVHYLLPMQSATYIQHTPDNKLLRIIQAHARDSLRVDIHQVDFLGSW